VLVSVVGRASAAGRAPGATSSTIVAGATNRSGRAMDSYRVMARPHQSLRSSSAIAHHNSWSLRRESATRIEWIHPALLAQRPRAWIGVIPPPSATRTLATARATSCSRGRRRCRWRAAVPRADATPR
jgi:hypothetical protein